MAEPAAKKQKTETDAEMPDAEKAAPEEVKELEEDAPNEKGPKIQEEISFLVPDTTMNVMPSTVGNILMPITEGGVAHLVAGARASVGVKSGRYMFEAKIIEY